MTLFGDVKKELLLSKRIYECEACGNKEDRDWNASKNIRDYYTVSSTGINAHGQNVRRENHNESNRCLDEVRNQQKIYA